MNLFLGGGLQSIILLCLLTFKKCFTKVKLTFFFIYIEMVYNLLDIFTEKYIHNDEIKYYMLKKINSSTFWKLNFTVLSFLRYF